MIIINNINHLSLEMKSGFSIIIVCEEDLLSRTTIGKMLLFYDNAQHTQE